MLLESVSVTPLLCCFTASLPFRQTQDLIPGVMAEQSVGGYFPRSLYGDDEVLSLSLSLSEVQRRFGGMKKGYVGNLGGWILSVGWSYRSEIERRFTET